MRIRDSLDSFDLLPSDMRAYLRHNGYHFNKKMCDFACKQLHKKGEVITPWGKEDVDSMLKRNGVEIEESGDYDYVFVANMAKSDFYGSSLADESHLALFIKDYVEDKDQADGFIFNRFFADMVRKGQRIPWEEVL